MAGARRRLALRNVIRGAITLSACLALTTSALAATPGAKLWQARYTSAGTVDEAGRVVRVSPGGSLVFVTGDPSRTIAYDATTGDKVWSRLEGASVYTDALAVSPDGSTVFVTGGIAGSTEWDIFTAAYDAQTGHREWTKRFDATGVTPDWGFAVAAAPDNSSVAITGYSVEPTGSYADVRTIVYDAADGTLLWTKLYDGPGHADDDGYAIEYSPDGSGLFVTGYSVGTGGDYVTIAYDALTGSKRWARRHVIGVANALAVAPDGSTVFVTGGSASVNDPYDDYVTIAYDALTGERRWMKRYDGPEHATDDARAIAVDPSGTVVFVTGTTGSSVGTSNEEATTIAYDASTGNRLWIRRYGTSTSASFGSSIAVHPSGGQVYVAGSTSDANGSSFVTIAYDAAAGQQVWVKAREGHAASVDVAPDGHAVYVTGGSQGVSSGLDMLTVAYATG